MLNDKDTASYLAASIDPLLDQLEKNTRSIEYPGPIEPLHRARVSLRRLRNALSAFEDLLPSKRLHKWSKSLRRLAKASGPARDIDVKTSYILRLKPDMTRIHAIDGMEKMLSVLKTQRLLLQKPLFRALQGLKNDKTIEDIRSFLKNVKKTADPPLLFAVARNKIKSRREELLHLEACIQDEQNVAGLHAMRIAVKKFRYTLENFQTLFPPALLKDIENLRRAQGFLGAVHDCDVWMKSFSQILKSEIKTPSSEAAARLFLQKTRMRRSWNYKRFVSFWKSLDKSCYPWRMEEPA